MKVKRPDSTCGRKASCWLLLKRWTSSTKTTVARPEVRAACARSTASRMSLTPPSTADMAMNWASKASAIRRASVVLPTPGGPHRIIECSRPDSNATRKRLAGAEQMALADDLVERLRPQPLGERSGGGVGEAEFERGLGHGPIRWRGRSDSAASPARPPGGT